MFANSYVVVRHPPVYRLCLNIRGFVFVGSCLAVCMIISMVEEVFRSFAYVKVSIQKSERTAFIIPFKIKKKLHVF